MTTGSDTSHRVVLWVLIKGELSNIYKTSFGCGNSIHHCVGLIRVGSCCVISQGRKLLCNITGLDFFCHFTMYAVNQYHF